jgi:hypothetical protein
LNAGEHGNVQYENDQQAAYQRGMAAEWIFDAGKIGKNTAPLLAGKFTSPGKKIK